MIRDGQIVIHKNDPVWLGLQLLQKHQPSFCSTQNRNFSGFEFFDVPSLCKHKNRELIITFFKCGSPYYKISFFQVNGLNSAGARSDDAHLADGVSQTKSEVRHQQNLVILLILQTLD